MYLDLTRSEHILISCQPLPRGSVRWMKLSLCWFTAPPDPLTSTVVLRYLSFSQVVSLPERPFPQVTTSQFVLKHERPHLARFLCVVHVYESRTCLESILRPPEVSNYSDKDKCVEFGLVSIDIMMKIPHNMGLASQWKSHSKKQKIWHGQLIVLALALFLFVCQILKHGD